MIGQQLDSVIQIDKLILKQFTIIKCNTEMIIITMKCLRGFRDVEKIVLG